MNKPYFTTSHGVLYDADCLEVLRQMKSGVVDTVFADPPFNIGKDYKNGYNDKVRHAEYLAWCRQWILECCRILRPGGAFFLYATPELAVQFAPFMGEVLDFRHWIALSMKGTYPRGKKLYPAHYALLYYTRGVPHVFNKLRLPIETCRHCGGEIRDYGGHRNKMNPEGVNLTDFWPDTSPNRHKRFKVRQGVNELKLVIPERAILISTEQGGLVFDPFGGGGSTYQAAEKHHRNWTGTELYDSEHIRKRIEENYPFSASKKPNFDVGELFVKRAALPAAERRLGEKPVDGTVEAIRDDIKEHSPDWGIPSEGDNGPVSAATDNREGDNVVDFSKKRAELSAHRYVFDIETNGVDFNHPNPASQVHTIHCITARNADTDQIVRVNSNDRPKMERFIRWLMMAAELIGQNILDFDIPAIQNLYPWFNPLGRKTDTKIMSQVMFPDIKPVDEKRWPVLIRQGLSGRHSLEAWGERLGEPKDAYKKWCEENGIADPWGQWSERMEDYCEQDTTTTFIMYQFLRREAETSAGWDLETFEKIVQLEQDVFEVIRRQRVHGFGFDTEKAKDLYLELQSATDLIAADLREKYVAQLIMPDGRKLKTYKKDMIAKHPTIPGCKTVRRAGAEFCPVKVVDFNPGSSDHIAALLINNYGWEPTEGTLTDKSKDLYKQLAMNPEDVPQAVREKKLSVSGAEEVLKALPYPFIDDVLHYQKQAKVCSMVGGGEKSWLACERDGRIHGKVNTLGAATARMTHNDPNVAQTPAVSTDKEGEPKTGLDGGFGFECRSCYQAGEGKVLVGCDAAGLELRMLGHYMALYDGGAYAEAVIKGDKDQGTDVHSLAMQAMDFNNRNDTKTGEYAFLYGGGDEKLGAITFKQFTEEQAKAFGPSTPSKLKALGADIRAKLIGGFPGLESLVEALGKAFERGWLRGLDGRVLRPRKEHSILNLLLQSAGAIVMKHALVLADRRFREIGLQPGRDYEFVANIHDEWQIETTPELSERIAKIAAIAIEKVERRLKMRVPLAGDSKIGPTWAKTH